MTPEGAIKKAICEYLSYCQDVFFWQQDSTGTFDPKRKVFRKKKSKFQRNGIPDIILIVRFNGLGFFLGLEVKSDSGEQTPSQKLFQGDLNDFLGSKMAYAVVRSPEEAQIALNAFRKHIRAQLSAV